VFTAFSTCLAAMWVGICAQELPFFGGLKNKDERF
jgi:hypothetical protein